MRRIVTETRPSLSHPERNTTILGAAKNLARKRFLHDNLPAESGRIVPPDFLHRGQRL
jgi:hypothetical protein